MFCYRLLAILVEFCLFVYGFTWHSDAYYWFGFVRFGLCITALICGFVMDVGTGCLFVFRGIDVCLFILVLGICVVGWFGLFVWF